MFKKIVFWAVTLLLLALVCLGTFGVLIPLERAESGMPPSGQLTLAQQTDGTWLLSWPKAKDGASYCIEIFRGSAPGAEEEPLYRDFSDSETMRLPALPANMEMTLRVSSFMTVNTLLGQTTRYGEQTLDASFDITDVTPPALTVTVDGDEATAYVQARSAPDTQWRYQLVDAGGNVLDEQTPSGASVSLCFGEGGAYSPPGEGQSFFLRAKTVCRRPGLELLSVQTEDYPISWESLQPRKLEPVLTERSKNTFALTWSETKGERYQVEKLNDRDGVWDPVCQVEAQEPRTYVFCLEPGQTVQYRVTALDAQGQVVTASEPLPAVGRSRTQYATVWPTQDLAIFSTPYGDAVIGTARVGSAYCVLDEENGMFAVRAGDRTGYIESGYCMINLPEYLGGLCSYNITNSVYSIYAVHEFAIPNVTGMVTVGYENVCQEDGSFLVPLVYPAAKKLLAAAQRAADLGYRLKIYDSFRPYVATRQIYDLTEQVLNMPLPDTTYTGVSKEEMDLPPPAGGSEELTLGWLMTGPNYMLASFLAQVGSAHNLGIAMDLTLEELDTGSQLEMQSSIHDLSQYSVLKNNNENADILGDIMKGVGFDGLVSEWWHFQDNDAKEELGLHQVINGVSAECWMRDDYGWRYRGPKGHYAAGETLTIGGNTYSFDQNGYVVN